MPRTISTTKADAILSAVCDVWHVGKEELLGRSRRQPVAFARQVAMAVTYQLTHMSLDDVGEYYGERDHGTVLWARKVVNKAADDAAVKDLVSRVVKKIPTPQGHCPK